MKKWTYKTDESVYLKMRLSTYPYLENSILKCQNELERIITLMLGIKSSSNYPIIPNNDHSYRNMVIEYGEKKEEWEKKLEKYQAEIKELDDIVNSIDDETDREFILDVYKNSLSNKELIDKYFYADEKYVYKIINRILNKISENK
jgi:hypothetical protein